MIFGVLIELATGMLCIVLGLLLWKKQKISLLHDYHYQNVKKEDVPAYTRQMGIGLITIGTGIFLTALLDAAYSSFWWIPLTAGFFLGLVILYSAQKRYNGSMFS